MKSQVRDGRAVCWDCYEDSAQTRYLLPTLEWEFCATSGCANHTWWRWGALKPVGTVTDLSGAPMPKPPGAWVNDRACACGALFAEHARSGSVRRRLRSWYGEHAECRSLVSRGAA